MDTVPAAARFADPAADPAAERAAFDAVVVGGGPAGLTAALALAQAGARTAVVARRVAYADNRTTALLGGSVDLLERLGVWPRCAAAAAPLTAMRLIDDTGRLIRAPEVRFDAAEIGRDAFGFNIANVALIAALDAAADEAPRLTRFDAEAVSVDPDDSAVTVRLGDGTALSAPLVVGADGRASACRDAAGIAVTRKDLDQAALTLTIRHSRPHRGVSTEFHTAQGPCVFVPLPGDRCSIVWVARPDEAARLMALDDAALAFAVERQAHSILGRVTVEPGRHLFPLTLDRPATSAQNRIALVGEAAHVLPPIGAQGLNLGLRDADDLADIVGAVLLDGGDPGAPEVLYRYAGRRRGDIVSRSAVIDLAGRSLLSDLLPVQAARAAGMHLVGGLAPLRKLAMREGLAPSWRSERQR